MIQSPQSLKVRIGGRDFFVNCAANDHENLLNAAQTLNSEISRIQNSSQSTTITLEASAVMAALNFAAELQDGGPADNNQNASEHIDRLIGEIDIVLEN